MRMSEQPRIVPARQGLLWLKEGFRLFHKAPLIWALCMLAYWSALMLISILPVLGLVVPLVLSPGLGFGFILVAQAIDRGHAAAPIQLVSGFRAPGGRRLLHIGLLYLAGLGLVLLLSVLADGEWYANLVREAVEEGEVTSAESGLLPTGLLVAIIGYLPLMIALWYAPQLIIWRQFGAGKALFYSFFAVWRNRAAFLVYGLGWLAVIVLASLLLSAILSALGAGPAVILLGVIPISLLLMAIGHGSFYASTRDVFEDHHQTDALA